MKRRKSSKSRRKSATKTDILRRFTRAEMISALGLEAEGSKRGDKYDYTTSEYAGKIANSIFPSAARARKKLGLGEPS